MTDLDRPGIAAPDGPGDPQPLKRASLVDEVATKLRHEILTGALQPGAPISVAELGRRLGVSHIPIREAFRQLEAEALIESTPHRAAIVADVRIGELSEIYDLRRLIEGDMVRRAVPLATAAHAAVVQRALDRLLAADARDPHGDFWQAHRDFHWAVFTPVMDSWRLRILSLLWQSAERYQRLTQLVFRPANQSRAEHRAIAKCYREGDAEGAAAAVIHHLRQTEETVKTGYLGARTEREPGTGMRALPSS